VTQSLTLELGFTVDIGAAGLTQAIIEALEKGGVLEEAGIVYIRAEAPGQRLAAIDIWAPEPEAPVIPPDPPVMPVLDDEPLCCAEGDGPYKGCCRPEPQA
jgi:hypothetical protein